LRMKWGGKVGRGSHVCARAVQHARELTTNAFYDWETNLIDNRVENIYLSTKHDNLKRG
jgi:hypothetical protein